MGIGVCLVSFYLCLLTTTMIRHAPNNTCPAPPSGQQQPTSPQHHTNQTLITNPTYILAHDAAAHLSHSPQPLWPPPPRIWTTPVHHGCPPSLASSGCLQDASSHVWSECLVMRGMGWTLEWWQLYLLHSCSGFWFLHQSVLDSSSFSIYTAVVTVEWILWIANDLWNVWKCLNKTGMPGTRQCCPMVLSVLVSYSRHACLVQKGT